MTTHRSTNVLKYLKGNVSTDEKETLPTTSCARGID